MLGISLYLLLQLSTIHCLLPVKPKQLHSPFLNQNLCHLPPDSPPLYPLPAGPHQLILHSPTHIRYLTPEGPVSQFPHDPQQLCNTLALIKSPLIEKCASFNLTHVVYPPLPAQPLFAQLHQPLNLKKIIREIIPLLEQLQKLKLKAKINIDSLYYDGQVHITDVQQGDVIKGIGIILGKGVGYLMAMMITQKCLQLPVYTDMLEMAVELGNLYGTEREFELIKWEKEKFKTRDQALKEMLGSGWEVMWGLMQESFEDVKDIWKWGWFKEENKKKENFKWTPILRDSEFDIVLQKVREEIEKVAKEAFLQFTPVEFKEQNISDDIGIYYRVKVQIQFSKSVLIEFYAEDYRLKITNVRYTNTFLNVLDISQELFTNLPNHPV